MYSKAMKGGWQASRVYCVILWYWDICSDQSDANSTTQLHRINDVISDTLSSFEETGNMSAISQYLNLCGNVSAMYRRVAGLD